MDNVQRKYAFDWSLVVPDTGDCRPSLGNSTRLEVYRLFQFTLRDVLERRFSTDAVDRVFREAGAMAGKAFFEHFCADVKDVNELTKRLQQEFKNLGIGILRFEKIDLEALEITLTVDEDLDCSGLPDTNDQICTYDEGLIQGILEAFTGKQFRVREIDCWCTGERTCRFNAKLDAPGPDRAAVNA